MPFYVYIIYSPVFDKYYVGQTNNFDNRIERHNLGYENSTSPYKPWTLKCIIEKQNRTEAMALERKLKNLNRAKLLQFIEKYG